MLERFSLFPEQASTVAGQVDTFYFFLVAVSGFFATLIATLIIVFAIKFRRRSENDFTPPIHGSLKLELFWTLIPFALTMVMFFWGASLYLTIRRPPDDALQGPDSPQRQESSGASRSVEAKPGKPPEHSDLMARKD